MTAALTGTEIRSLPPDAARLAIREGRWTGQTAGLAEGYVQANLVILPSADALDFAEFCRLNPKPCPVIDTTKAGSPHPILAAPAADLRTDLPRYRVYRDGDLVDEPLDVSGWWQDDLVAFLLGCSFTFEHGLLRAGIPMRHIDAGTGVPMWRTNRACTPVGDFHGPLVVSMRPIPAHQVDLAIEVSGRLPEVHGAPVHVGDPGELGISDLSKPDWGDAPIVEDGDVPVFWACGVTPQAVALESKPGFMITHSPGHMFVTDLRIEDLKRRG
ncbi:MAG: putative hydro-lyase [Thermomicrobiales bacterium]